MNLSIAEGNVLAHYRWALIFGYPVGPFGARPKGEIAIVALSATICYHLIYTQ